MSNRLQHIGIWMLVALMAGCTTFRPLPPRGSSQELAMQLKVGDDIRVTTRSGERLDFEVTEVGQSSVSGTRNGNTIQVSYDQIAAVDVHEFDGLKTLGLTALSITAAFGVLLAAVLASW
jgi:hypothetical protein